MKIALIGATGFVGGNILAEHTFDDLYNSKNIAEIHGKEYALVVSAGAPAVVWYANQHPEEDMQILQRLMEHLKQVQAAQFVLISSVDVYPDRVGVDEDTVIDPAKGTPYGRNRFTLEQFVRRQFPHALIVRLPALFGKGIKKNFVFDLLHTNALDFTHKDSIFQYYDLNNLWSDIECALQHKIELLNIAVEPIKASDVAHEVFGIEFTNVTADKPPMQYDMQTKRASVWGNDGRYLYSRRESVEALKRFVAAEKARMASASPAEQI